MSDSDIAGLIRGLASTLAEVKADIRHMRDEQKEIGRDVKDLGERMVKIEGEVARAQEDISKRTHREETKRLADRIESLEGSEAALREELNTRPRARLIYWAVGLPSTAAAAVIIAQITGLISP